MENSRFLLFFTWKKIHKNYYLRASTVQDVYALQRNT